MNDIDRNEVKDILLHIYANPVYSKKRIELGEMLDGE